METPKYIFFSFFVLLCNISYQYFLKFREQIIKAHNQYHLWWLSAILCVVKDLQSQTAWFTFVFFFFGKITTYSPMIIMAWLKFKLPNCNLKFNILPTKVWPIFKLLISSLKSHYANVLMDFFLSCIFMFFVFLKERDFKVEQNYILTSVFNRCEL